MSLQQTLSLCAVVAILSVGATRYYFPTIQTKTVEVTKEVVKTDVQTVTHTITLPSGAVDTTTTTTDHSQRIETDNKTSVVLKTSKLNVSALVASDFSQERLLLLYGVSVSKEVLGPVTVGLFGLTNGTIGLSVGINF